MRYIQERRLFLLISSLLLVTLLLLVYVRYARVKGEKLAAEVAAPEDQHLPHVTVTFLDIGQGDASYIIFPSGEDMLIDCAKDGRILVALGRVMTPFDRTIDYLIVTHPDNDHYGGCIDVLKRFRVNHIVYNGLRKNQEPYWRYFWDMVESEDAVYHEIGGRETWELASSTFSFLYPDHPVTADMSVPGSVEEPIDNNTSIVAKLTFGAESVLFTGDTERALEEYLVGAAKGELDSDVLKVGHHGSPGSSSQAFVDAVSPRYASISVGKENTYGHPSQRVIRRLERSGADIWRTDESGDIEMRLYKDAIFLHNNR